MICQHISNVFNDIAHLSTSSSSSISGKGSNCLWSAAPVFPLICTRRYPFPLLFSTTILHFVRGLYRLWPSAECRVWCLGTWKNICAACTTCGANLHNTCISHKHFDQSAVYTSNTSISSPFHHHPPSNPNVCCF